MAKYSYEFKKKVAQAYPNREGSYRYLAKKYKVSSVSRIAEWAYSFKEFGSDGLLRSRVMQDRFVCTKRKYTKVCHAKGTVMTTL